MTLDPLIPSTQDILRRLQILEKQNQRGKKAAALFVLLLGALMLSGQASRPRVPKVIEAERFTVKDTNGTPRASWGIGSTGALVLGFFDKSGKTRITLSVEPDGSPILYLYGKDQTRRFLLYLNEGDLPELALFNTEGKRRVGLVVDAKVRSAGLLVFDSEERKRASLFVENDGLAAMTLLDKNENLQFGVGESKNGSLVTLNDSKGNTRIILGTLSQGPTLRLYDERGGVIGKIP
jgi:hypothetical protein